MNKIQFVAGAKRAKICVERIGGPFRFQCGEGFDSEGGVVEIAGSGPIAKAAIVMNLTAEKVDRAVGGVTQEIRRLGRGASHVQSQTHCTSL